MEFFDINTNSEIIPDSSPISAIFSEISEIYSSVNGHSVIFKGKRFGKWHALKTIKKEFLNLPQYENLLLKEFEISYLQNHPDIVQVIGFEQVEIRPSDIRPCIIMEYLDSITLEEFLNENSFTAEEIRPIIEEICNGINYIHKKGIIHRDIKETNILITLNGNHAKLIDFGLSDSSKYAILKEAAGSYPYASPEQKNNKTPIDNRADIYALGILLEYINSKLATKLPHINEIVRKCTETNRGQRYSCANDVYKKLNNTRNYTTAAIIASIFITALLSSIFAYNTGIHVRAGSDMVKNIVDQQSIDGASTILIFDTISRLVIQKATEACNRFSDTLKLSGCPKGKIVFLNRFNKHHKLNKEAYPLEVLNQYLPKNSPEYNLYKSSLIQLSDDVYKKFYDKNIDSLGLIRRQQQKLKQKSINK